MAAAQVALGTPQLSGSPRSVTLNWNESARIGDALTGNRRERALRGRRAGQRVGEIGSGSLHIDAAEGNRKRVGIIRGHTLRGRYRRVVDRIHCNADRSVRGGIHRAVVNLKGEAVRTVVIA